jgi:hypothetical protein
MSASKTLRQLRDELACVKGILEKHNEAGSKARKWLLDISESIDNIMGDKTQSRPEFNVAEAQRECAEATGTCETCRWWVKREMDSDAIAKIEGLAIMQDTPENRKYFAMCSAIARENLKHGIGDCYGVPQTIEKGGADFCGQWTEQEGLQQA